MLIAQTLDEVQIILIGLSFLVAAFLLRRNVTLSGKSRRRDVVEEVREDFRQREQTTVAHIHQMETHLHDYGREVEGRIHTTLTVLDQLVLEADQEIARLETLLEETGRTLTNRTKTDSRRVPDIIDHATPPRFPGADEPDAESIPASGRRREKGVRISAEKRRMIACLGQAGFSASEIAVCLDCPADLVQSVLDDDSALGRAKAA